MTGRPYSNPKPKYMPDHVAALMKHKGEPFMGPLDDAYYVGEAHHNRCINCSQFQRRKAKNYPDAIHGRCAIDQPINGRVYWVEGKMGCPWWTRASALQEAKTIYFSDPKVDAPEIDLSTYLIVLNLKPAYEGSDKTAYDAASAVKEYLGADGVKLYQTTDGGLFVSMQVAYVHQLELNGGEIPYEPLPGGKSVYPDHANHTKTEIKWLGVDLAEQETKALAKNLTLGKSYGMGPAKFAEVLKKQYTPPLQKYEYQIAYDQSPSGVLKEITEKIAKDLVAEIDQKLFDEMVKYENQPVGFSIGGKIPPLYGGDPIKPGELADLKYGTKMPIIGNIHNTQVTSPNPDELSKVLEAINSDMDKHDTFYKALGMKGSPKYPY